MTLPTCWSCPTPDCLNVESEAAYRGVPNPHCIFCNTAMQQASVVPLSASVQTILALLPEAKRREGWVINKIATRVFNGEAVSVSVDLEHPAPRYEDEYTSVVVVLSEREADPDAG